MNPSPKVWPVADHLVIRPHTKYLGEISRIAMLGVERIDVVFNLDKVADPVVASRVPTIHTVPGPDKRQWLWDTASAVVTQINAGRRVLLHDDGRMDRSAAVAAVVRRLTLGESAEAAIAAVKAAQPKIVWATNLTKFVADAPVPPEAVAEPARAADARGRRRTASVTPIGSRRAAQMLRSVASFLETGTFVGAAPPLAAAADHP